MHSISCRSHVVLRCSFPYADVQTAEMCYGSDQQLAFPSLLHKDCIWEYGCRYDQQYIFDDALLPLCRCISLPELKLRRGCLFCQSALGFENTASGLVCRGIFFLNFIISHHQSKLWFRVKYNQIKYKALAELYDVSSAAFKGDYGK